MGNGRGVERLFYQHEKLALLIDGPSTHAATQALGFTVDWKRLHEHFIELGVFVTANFYYQDHVRGPDEKDPLRGLTTWLDDNLFSVRGIPAVKHGDGKTKFPRGSISDHIMADIASLAPNVDHFVLFSGGASYVPMIFTQKTITAEKFTVVSTSKTDPPIVSSELRKVATQFIDLDDLREDIKNLELANKS